MTQARGRALTGSPVPEHLSDLYQRATQPCDSANHRLHIQKLLRRYQDIFSAADHDIGSTDLVKHDVPVMPGGAPIRQPARRLGPEKEEEVEWQVKDLAECALIVNSSSAVLGARNVKKDGKWRLCVDYWRLNAVTQQDAYPLPRIDESLGALAGIQFFSTLDLLSGYWQIPLSEDTQGKATFITCGWLWEWKVLPFGLTSTPSTVQRLMERVLTDLHWKTLLLYLDNIIVVGPDFQTHMTWLEEVLVHLRGRG